MEFEIELVAKTIDEGGLVQSFARQLAEFGEAQVELLSETPPYRVETSGSFFFEARRTYKIIL